MKELRQAASEGNLSKVIELCEKNQAWANEAGPKTRRTPLHWAAYGGHTEIVSYLLKTAKVKIDPLDINLNTPLNFVIQAPELPLSKKLAIVEMLLTHHADPAHANTEGRTALMNLLSLKKIISGHRVFLNQGVDSAVRKMKERIIVRAKEAGQTICIDEHGRVRVENTSSLPFHVPTMPDRSSLRPLSIIG